MENYGKLWKVMESLRRVKHDWATKQREDNVRTRVPGQASLALAMASWSSWSSGGMVFGLRNWLVQKLTWGLPRVES